MIRIRSRSKAKKKKKKKKSGKGKTFLDQRYPRSGPWRPYHQHGCSAWQTQRRWWIWNQGWNRRAWTSTAGCSCPRRSHQQAPTWTSNRTPHHHDTPPSLPPFPSPPTKLQKPVLQWRRRGKARFLLALVFWGPFGAMRGTGFKLQSNE